MTGGNLRKARERIPDVQWPEAEEAVRTIVLRRWRVIIEHEPTASDVGYQILEALLNPDGMTTAVKIISDVFSCKATKTLQKRSGAIIAYMTWAASNGHHAFPLEEPTCYAYMMTLQAKAATAPSSFLQAVAFTLGMLGLHGAELVTKSKRIQGVSFASLLCKRKPEQRRPFEMQELRWLENLVMKGENLQECLCRFHLLPHLQQSKVLRCHCSRADHSRRSG